MPYPWMIVHLPCAVTKAGATWVPSGGSADHLLDSPYPYASNLNPCLYD